MGFPGCIHGSWYGLVAPARTPVAIINRLYVESVKVLKDQELVAVLTRGSGVAGGNTPQDFAREIREEIAELARVIQAAMIRL